jgi:lipopolysaccharide biosynthesis glycosyltransferase
MKEINILASSDDNFIIFLAVMLKSAILNHKSNEKINAYILDSGISKKNKKLLLDNFTESKISFYFIDVLKYVPSSLKSFNVSYYRLVLAKALPKKIKKIIYLDCDLLFTADISGLWNIDIGKKIIGAANDFFIKKIRDGIANYSNFSLNPDNDYFNAGVMIINLDLWRKKGIERKCLDITFNNRNCLKCWDQYSLNIALNKNWKKIPQMWNFNAHFFTKNPKIIHYCSPLGKPLDSDYAGYFKEEFFNYLEKTEFKGKKPQVNYNVIRRFFFKLAKKMLKI